MTPLILALICFIIVIVIVYVLFFKEKEQFTNEQGFVCSSCENKTLSECARCANCGYCMNEGLTAKCVSGTVDGPTSGKCSKWYANDTWERSVAFDDNNAVVV